MFVDAEGDRVLVRSIVIVCVSNSRSRPSSAIGRQDRSLHVRHWNDVKLPWIHMIQWILVVGERERGNVSQIQNLSLLPACALLELSKFGVCANVSFISIDESKTRLEDFFFSSSVAYSFSLWFDFSVMISFLHALQILQNILCFWFLNWIEKFPLSAFSLLTSLSLKFSEGRLYTHNSNWYYFV